MVTKFNMLGASIKNRIFCHVKYSTIIIEQWGVRLGDVKYKVMQEITNPC